MTDDHIDLFFEQSRKTSSDGMVELGGQLLSGSTWGDGYCMGGQLFRHGDGGFV